MHRYRTEIVVSADRYVCLQLPGHFPEGPARVVVVFPGPEADGPGEPREDDGNDDDIEWWEDLDDAPPQAG